MSDNIAYRKIADALKAKIDGGTITPGERIPTVPMLRAEFGVSHITVLRAFKELTESGYIRKVPGLGYSAAERATPPSPPPRMIGGLLRQVSGTMKYDHYFNEIIAGIETELALSDCSLLLSGRAFRGLRLESEGEEGILAAALEMNPAVEGFLFDERCSDRLISDILTKTGKPGVVLNRETSADADSVFPDYRAAYHRLFATLPRLGYRRFVWSFAGYDTYAERCRKTLLDELRRHPEYAELEFIEMDRLSFRPQEEAQQDLLRTLENREGKRSVLLSHSDDSARSFAEFLISRGKEIPRDAGIVGLFGLLNADIRKPELCTLKVDTTGMGMQGCRLLLRRLNGNGGGVASAHPIPLGTIFGETV